MKWMLCLVSLVCVLAVGCVSKKAPYPNAINSGMTNPNSDYVGADVLKEALKGGASNVPEQMSQVQDSGLAHWQKSDSFVRNPDGTVYTIKVKDQDVPLNERYESLTKWANTATLGGGAKKIWLKIGNFFGIGRAQDNTTADPQYAHGGGFSLYVEDASGGISKDSSVVKAKYDGQAAVQAEIAKALGTALRDHWAGVANLVKVEYDGRVAVIGAVGGATKEVIGELAGMTLYGAATNAIKVLVKEDKGNGTVAADPTEVIVTKP
jgi:hypothetical protein